MENPWTMIAHDVPSFMRGDAHPGIDYGNPPKGTGRCWRLYDDPRCRIHILQYWNLLTLQVEFLVTCNREGAHMGHTTVSTLRAAKAEGTRFWEKFHKNEAP